MFPPPLAGCDPTRHLVSSLIAEWQPVAGGQRRGDGTAPEAPWLHGRAAGEGSDDARLTEVRPQMAHENLTLALAEKLGDRGLWSIWLYSILPSSRAG